MSAHGTQLLDQVQYLFLALSCLRTSAALVTDSPTHPRWLKVPEKEHDPHKISVMVAERRFNGAEFVVNSFLPSFRAYLLATVKVNEATVAFDATGGGNLEGVCGGVEGLGRCHTGL